MKVTVDANILFSSLIKDSITRKLFFNPVLVLFAPEYLKVEFVTHMIELKHKSGMEDEKLIEMVEKAFSQINFISDNDLKPFLPAAASLVKDSKDWMYISCALSKDTAIWSNDKGFKIQKRVRVLTTSELTQVMGVL